MPLEIDWSRAALTPDEVLAIRYINWDWWLVVSGAPDDLKRLPVVNPPGTKRLDVTCDHVTVGLQAVRHLPGVRTATVFGQSMHLLVEDTLTDDAIRAALAKAGIAQADIRPIAPSLEDVFVALTSRNGGK